MIQPIQGSWFEFPHHHELEGKYWNATCNAWTAAQWEEKTREMAALGLEYLVLMSVALNGRAYCDTPLLPRHAIGCEGPIEAVPHAAHRHGLKFFLSKG